METSFDQRKLCAELIKAACCSQLLQHNLTDEDRVMLHDLAGVAMMVTGPVLVSKQLWKFLGGNRRMTYSHFKQLGLVTLNVVSPEPLSTKDAMVGVERVE